MSKASISVGTLLGAALAAGCFLQPAQASVVVINFNSLSTGVIAGQTESGSGAGTFAVNDSPVTNYQRVFSSDLTYTGLPAQPGTAQHFSSSTGLGSPVSDLAYALARTPLSTALSGTVWYSYLGYLEHSGLRLGVTFNQSGATNAASSSSDATSFLVGGSTFRLRSGGSNLATGGSVAATTTYFVLGRITFGAGGADDTITQWINPNLAAIGANPTDANIDANSGTKLTASTFNFASNQVSSIGMFTYGAGGSSLAWIDRIRLSDNSGNQAYYDVIAPVPEPMSVALLTLGSLVAMRRNRRSRIDHD